MWATRNVDMLGTFCANPEDAGMFYHWNINTGWNSTNPMVNSQGGTIWDNTNSAGITWEISNNNYFLNSEDIFHKAIPQLTDTFNECFVPNCGISIHLSHKSNTFWSIPFTSFPTIKAIFSL